MTYKGCEIAKTEDTHHKTGQPLYKIEGRYSKPPKRRPYITTLSGAKEWINYQIITWEAVERINGGTR